jgi:hypothetical protein
VVPWCGQNSCYPPLSPAPDRLTIGDVARPIRLVIGALAIVVLGACGGGDDGDAAAATSTSVVETTVTTVAPTTTTARAASTTRVTTSRATTTTRPPSATTVASATTTRPALSRAAATQALCAEIETAVRQVAGGNTIGGGLRLTRAVNSYGDTADPAVVSPARRMLSSAVNGDLDASAVATREASTACARAGSVVNLPGPVQCVTTPCP